MSEWDPSPAVRAIALEDIDEMRKMLHVYSDPTTRFKVTTWNGYCTLPPLGLALEEPGRNVLHVLVQEAGLNPSAPYEIQDYTQGVCIRTNALTHMLARWNYWKSEEIRYHTLWALLEVGADASAPALYEVSHMAPPDAGASTGAKRQPPPHTHELAAVARQGLGLMAFQMVQRLPLNPQFYFIDYLIEKGSAQFRPEDPTGLFVKSVLTREENHRIGEESPTQLLENLMIFLCPDGLLVKKIAGGLVAPGATAHGELRRIVQGMDPDSGMNILHLYVALGSAYRLMPTVQRILMLRDIYGLDLCLPTADGRTLTALAAASTNVWAQRMQQAVAEALEDEFLKRHRALALVQGLPSLPRETLYRLGRETGLPMVGAYELDARLLPPDDPRRSRRKSQQRLT